MKPWLVLSVVLASPLALGTANAQSEQDANQAMQAFLRLFATAQQPGVFSSDGRLSQSLGTFSNLRPTGACEVAYTYNRPNAPDLPEQHRGERTQETFTMGGKDEMRNVSISGGRLNYSYTRRNGRENRSFYQLRSDADARALWDAISTLNTYCNNRVPEQEAIDVVHDRRAKAGSLAIDRRNGSRYGWAVDYERREDADARALQECRRDGSSCQIVLRFRGGCGAYAIDPAKDSTRFGWGTAVDRSSAESRAREEVRKRGGTSTIIRVWGCNSRLPAGAVARDADLPPRATGAGPSAANVSDGGEKADNANAGALKEARTQGSAIDAQMQAAKKAQQDYQNALVRTQQQNDAIRAENERKQREFAARDALYRACLGGDKAACARYQSGL